ncbi:MAG: hypothetical protein LCH84_00610 [Gemmatimonadetes bacterium]|nr:hypothetical protein [Gemmatimonadota bacterium]
MSASANEDRPLGPPNPAADDPASDVSDAHDERPESLSEAEAEALAGWIPGNALALALVRGRPDGDRYPLWVATPQGVLTAAIAAGVRGQLRARTDWVPLDVIRRVVGIRNGAAVSVLLQARTRLFTLLSDDEAGARLFVATVRRVLAALGHRRRARPSVSPQRPPSHGEAA